MLTLDAPRDNQGKGESFSPTDLLLTGLASCLLITAGIKAKSLGLSLEGSRAFGEKVMTTEAPRRIARLTVELELTGSCDESARRDIESAIHSCPVSRSLNPEIDVEVKVEWA
ncbi:MAG: OsmC family protein [Fimbriimonadaceae bacterium]